MAWSGQFNDFGANHQVGHTIHPRTTQKNMSTNHLSPSVDMSIIGNHLQLGICGMPIVAVIIGKSEPRAIPSKKDGQQERYVLSMTIRDSPSDFINVSFWGGEDYARSLAEQFHIGDVVELGQAIVQSKPLDGSDERYRPWTPGMYQLTMSENKSNIKLYGGAGVSNFVSLVHAPVKAGNDFYTITDITTNGQRLNGEFVSILAVVKHVSAMRELTTKTGRQIKRCEVKVLDQTASSFTMVVWDEELIMMAQSWQPRDHVGSNTHDASVSTTFSSISTAINDELESELSRLPFYICVIFAADVKASYDNYKKSMIVTASSKTIITVNPDTPEAYALFEYAQSADCWDAEDDGFSDISRGGNVALSSIQDVYTTEEMKAKQSSMAAPEAAVEHGILYAHISTMDIDSEPARKIATRCGKCNRRIDLETNLCTNTGCPASSATIATAAATDTDVVSAFNIRLSLSDHTGTVDGCSLMGDVAEKLLGCKVSSFLGMSDEERTQLKWQFLLEKCKVYVKMCLPTLERPNPFTRILSCEKADLQEAARFIH